MNPKFKKYELPYNFDKDLIKGYQMIGIPVSSIFCIYVPPFYQDYKSILRGKPEDDIIPKLSYEVYLDHIQYINSIYPNKLQLLLQRTDGTIMPSVLIKKYIGLGFKNFCVGSLEQAKIIKEIDSSLTVVGSIAMHITYQNIIQNISEYQKYFNSFVLDFKYNKNFLSIKLLPKNFSYILLVNSQCNIHCDGDHHWWGKSNNFCPGIFGRDVDFYNSCVIRPMDLDLFDPYISVYKIQDRGWDTSMILREVILYSTNYKGLPNLHLNDATIYQTSLYSKS